MKIRIRSLILFQIYYMCVIEFAVSVFHLPGILRYFLDVNILVCGVYTLCINSRQNKIGDVTEYIRLKRYIAVYCLFVVLCGIINLVPLGQVVWAIRNNLFVVFYLFLCVKYLDFKDVEKIFNVIVKLQFFNLACVFFEFFILHVQNDYLGGMFGVAQGCNGALNIYLVVVTVLVLTMYMEKKCSVVTLILSAISSLVSAALSELKFFYIEFFLIVVLLILLNRKTLKGFITLAISVVGGYIGINVLSTVNSNSMQYLESLEQLFSYGSRSDFGYGNIRIARLTAFSQINEYFFKDSTLLQLIGYGFGSCEESESFSVCNSYFADTYGYLGYRNLTSSMNYLETGMVGLLAFLTIFVILFVIANKYKKNMGSYTYVATLTQIFSILLIINCFYNSTIRRPIAYLSFFIIAGFFICIRECSYKDSEV